VGHVLHHPCGKRGRTERKRSSLLKTDMKMKNGGKKELFEGQNG